MASITSSGYSKGPFTFEMLPVISRAIFAPNIWERVDGL